MEEQEQNINGQEQQQQLKEVNKQQKKQKEQDEEIKKEIKKDLMMNFKILEEQQLIEYKEQSILEEWLPIELIEIIKEIIKEIRIQLRIKELKEEWNKGMIYMIEYLEMSMICYIHDDIIRREFYYNYSIDYLYSEIDKDRIIYHNNRSKSKYFFIVQLYLGKNDKLLFKQTRLIDYVEIVV